ncbi:MAG: hypothetical protein QOE92_129 [Chloroflexota bacterium]|nr:hypothetical protein [Chloroflexota bacterium]
MTWVQYLLGLLALGLIAFPPAAAAWLVRRRLVPRYRWPLARAVEALLVLVAWLTIAKVLGTVGAFRVLPYTGACVTVAAVAGLLAWRTAPARATANRSPIPATPDLARGPLTAAVVVAVVVVLVAGWSGRVGRALTEGPATEDTLRYHLPYAAQFVLDGDITPLKQVEEQALTVFQPEDSELLDAVFMLPWHRDTLVPLLNLGWLALALLAAWSLGAWRGAGRALVAGVGLLMTLPLMVQTQAGTAGNDVAAVALLLLALALLLDAEGGSTPVVLAGAALGVALGMKLYILPVIVVLLVALAVAAVRGRRPGQLVGFTIAMAVTGSYWFLRNLARTGSPLPTVSIGVGPFRLPHPASAEAPFGFSVAHYILRPSFWTATVPERLGLVLGIAGPVVVGLGVAGLVLGLVLARGWLRWFAAAGLAAAFAYVFTPWGAATFPNALDNPALFGVNFRYALPALVIGTALLPMSRFLATPRRMGVFLGAVALLFLAAQTATGDKWTTWGVTDVRAALLAGAGVAAGAGLLWLHRRPPTGRVVAVGAGVLALVLAAGAGYRVEQRYERTRYASGNPSGDAYDWARGVSGSRIAVYGLLEAYPLYGTDLSNRVEFVGTRQADGGFVLPATCQDWRHQVDEGGYQYVVVRSLNRDPAPPTAWTESSPAASVVVRDAGTTVYQLRGPLDSSSCPR